MRLGEYVVAAAAALLGSHPARAEGTASGGVAVRVTVPEVCQIEAGDVGVGRGDSQVVATIFEMCNVASGVQILASHRSLTAGEQVRVTYDGRSTELQPGGVSELGSRAGPFVGRRQIAIDARNLTDSIAISFGMTAV